MARKSKLKLRPLNTGKETFGCRLARLRKAKGFTKVELAEKMDIIKMLVSDYELDKLRPYHDEVALFAQALDVFADELLGLKPSKIKGNGPTLKILRRMKKIEDLPATKQKFFLKTIDSLIKAAER